MKVVGLLCLAIVLSGCASRTNKYANDPRAHCVGAAYLDYIDEYPPDRDTQFFYPSFFVVSGAKDVSEPAPTPQDQQIQPLLTVRPEPTQEVKAITGQGWPKLESTGVPFFCGEPR
jgi:hypothetical protein